MCELSALARGRPGTESATIGDKHAQAYTRTCRSCRSHDVDNWFGIAIVFVVVVVVVVFVVAAAVVVAAAAVVAVAVVAAVIVLEPAMGSHVITKTGFRDTRILQGASPG